MDSGHWPLYRFDPRLAAQGKQPLQLDSMAPKSRLMQYVKNETRYRMVEQMNPEGFKKLCVPEYENLYTELKHNVEMIVSPWPDPRHARWKGVARRHIVNLHEVADVSARPFPVNLMAARGTVESFPPRQVSFTSKMSLHCFNNVARISKNADLARLPK